MSEAASTELFERRKIGVKRKRTIKLKMGEIIRVVGDEEVVVKKDVYIDTEETYLYKYPVLKRDPGWEVTAYYWSTARPVRASVPVVSPVNSDCLPLTRWERLKRWLGFRSNLPTAQVVK